MDRDSYLAQLGSDGRRISELARGDLDAAVPTCPGWNLRDLVEHTGGVHRWMIAATRERTDGSPEGAKDDAPGADESWADWFQRGVDVAISTMSALDGTEERWTWFPPDQTAGWYFRRIAHETLVHRIDAELAAGVALLDVDAQVAADGVEEMCDVFLPSATGQAIGGDGRTLLLHATDVERDWRLTLHAERVDVARGPGSTEAEVHGAAVDLLLMCWGRDPLGAVERVGDVDVIDTFVAAAKI